MSVTTPAIRKMLDDYLAEDDDNRASLSGTTQPEPVGSALKDADIVRAPTRGELARLYSHYSPNRQD